MKRLRYFPIKNMENPEDAEKVKEILKGIEGVMRVDADLDAQAIEVEYEDSKVTKEMMAKILQSNGYLMGI